MAQCPQMTHLCAMADLGVQKGTHEHEVKLFVDGKSEEFPPRRVLSGHGPTRMAGRK